MSENHSLIRIRQTDYICDHCGEGRMIFTGASWEIKGDAIRSKLFCHRCEICNVQINYTVPYPKTEYLPETAQ